MSELALLAEQEQRTHSGRVSRSWVAPLSFALISAACVGAWVVQRVQARARIELQTRLTCEQVAIRLEEAIRARIAVAEGVRELIQVGEADSEVAFRHAVLSGPQK